MTGSGTAGDPYIIYDVNDLQAMTAHLSAYYELANDIDASATSTWNGGLGFEPIGNYSGSLYIVPQADVASSGSWAVYPASPTTHYDKVDDGATMWVAPTPDDNTTYTYISGLGYDQVNKTDVLYIPSYASIDYVMCNFLRCRASTYNASARCWPGLLVNSTWYIHPTAYVCPTASYVTYTPNAQWTVNPNTSAAWTPADVIGTGANPLQGFGIEITVSPASWMRFTTFYFEVSYTTTGFTGHLDGNSHTISNLYIDRPDADYVGMFGYVSGAASIKGVTMTSANITGYSQVGALVGSLAGDCSGDPVLNGCHVSGTVSGYNYVGGLIGHVTAVIPS